MKPIQRLLVVALALAVASASVAQSFDQRGTVEAGVTCPRLFRADDRSLWLLDSSLQASQVGDRLRVQGTPDPLCLIVC